MTTKPKARKYRVRRTGIATDPGAAAEAAGEDAIARSGDARSDTDAASPAPERAAEPPGTDPDAGWHGSPAAPDEERAEAAGPADAPEIEAIRREGLTGRQLRLARRVAQKRGLAPASDLDAVRQLRARGIDPFHHKSTLALVVTPDPDAAPDVPDEGSGSRPEDAAAPAETPAPKAEPAGTPGRRGDVQLPQTTPDGTPGLPVAEPGPKESPAERRAAEIARIQRDLVRRRRRKVALLVTRLTAFVLLPTLLAGYYFFSIATPLYSTKSQFLILANDAGGGGVGGLLSGTQFATNQDAIAVQSYLASKDAMLRLDRDEGFRTHFSQDFIDPLQRLDPDASTEETYKTYQRHVEIGYDPTEGVVKMEVTAVDPERAADFSRALISYAEERVDSLSQRKRANAVVDAETGLDNAVEARAEAQEALVRLQQESALLDPEGRIAALRSQINTFEVQLQEKRLQLQALLDNLRPNQSRVDGARADVRRLEAVLADLNTRMTTAQEGEQSLADVAVRVQLAEADLATRDMMLQSSLEQLETARRDANAQARYLTTAVTPTASEDPSYPRKFENTLLAFLIFSGIYLMISLTASILREQVSS